MPSFFVLPGFVLLFSVSFFFFFGGGGLGGVVSPPFCSSVFFVFVFVSRGFSRFPVFVLTLLWVVSIFWLGFFRLFFAGGGGFPLFLFSGILQVLFVVIVIHSSYYYLSLP